MIEYEKVCQRLNEKMNREEHEMDEIIETIKALEVTMKSRGETDEKIDMSIGSFPGFGEIFKKINRDRDDRGEDERGDCQGDDVREHCDERRDGDYRVGDGRGGFRNRMDENIVENEMGEKTVENAMDEKTVENTMNEKPAVEGRRTSKRKAKRSRRSR